MDGWHPALNRVGEIEDGGKGGIRDEKRVRQRKKEIYIYRVSAKKGDNWSTKTSFFERNF